jgi:hypothetical protein
MWSSILLLLLSTLMPAANAQGPGNDGTGDDDIVLYTTPLQPTQDDRVVVIVEVRAGANVTNITNMTLGYEVFSATGTGSGAGIGPVAGSANLTEKGNGTAGSRVLQADIGYFLPETRIDYWVLGNGTRIASASVTVAPLQSILWHHSLDEGGALARGLARPMMLLFYSYGSSASERMDREVFTDDMVIGNTSGIVSVRVDAGEEFGLVDEYGVDTYPTVIFLDANGTEVSRRAGFTEAGPITEELRHLRGEGPEPGDDKVTFVRPFMGELLMIGLSFLLFLTVILFVLRSKRWGT